MVAKCLKLEGAEGEQSMVITNGEGGATQTPQWAEDHAQGRFDQCWSPSFSSLAGSLTYKKHFPCCSALPLPLLFSLSPWSSFWLPWMVLLWEVRFVYSVSHMRWLWFICFSLPRIEIIMLKTSITRLLICCSLYLFPPRPLSSFVCLLPDVL